MSKQERKLYMNTQLRIIRVYHVRLHPDMTQGEAAMLWTTLYAAMFCDCPT